MRYIHDILDKIYKKEINVRQLSKETGISEAKMYKWQGRGSKITLEDAMKIEAWAALLDDLMGVVPSLENKDQLLPLNLEQISKVLRGIG